MSLPFEFDRTSTCTSLLELAFACMAGADAYICIGQPATLRRVCDRAAAGALILRASAPGSSVLLELSPTRAPRHVLVTPRIRRRRCAYAGLHRAVAVLSRGRRQAIVQAAPTASHHARPACTQDHHNGTWLHSISGPRVAEMRSFAHLKPAACACGSLRITSDSCMKQMLSSMEHRAQHG